MKNNRSQLYVFYMLSMLTLIIYPINTFADLDIFGPTQFERRSGQPESVSVDFSVKQSLENIFIIKITNGSSDKKTRVSSAAVDINGIQIFEPNDFNSNVEELSTNIVLQKDNVLSAEVRGKPGSFLIIEIKVDPANALDQLETVIKDILSGSTSPTETPPDLGFKIEIPSKIIAEFSKFTEEVVALELGSLKITAFIKPNLEAKMATRILLEKLDDLGVIENNDLLTVLSQHDIHAQNADAGGIVFPSGGDALFVDPSFPFITAYDTDNDCEEVDGENICEEGYVLVVDNDTHSFHKDVEISELIAENFFDSDHRLTTAASNMVHELIHAMIFRTDCLTEGDEETFVTDTESAINLIAGNAVTAEAFLNLLLEQFPGGHDCIDRLELSASFSDTEIVLQPGPNEGVDVWITSHFDYDDDFGVNDDKLLVGGWGDYYHALIKFDLTGLPANASSAEIHLYPYEGGGTSTPVSMYLDRVEAQWGEDTGWNDLYIPQSSVPNNPSDFQQIDTLPVPTVDEWFIIDITDLYNDWKDGSRENHGIQLRPTANDNRFNEFRSSDYVNENFRPKLVVTP